MRKSLAVISALTALTVAEFALPVSAHAEEPCAGMTLSGGQLLNCSTAVLAGGAGAQLTVTFNASCPLDGDKPDKHFWYVVLVVKHADGTEEGGAPQAAQEGSETLSGTDKRALSILPAGATSDDISWELAEHCHNSRQLIKSGSCTLCRAASGEDSEGEHLTKCSEGAPPRAHGKGKQRKVVCGLPERHEYNDGKVDPKTGKRTGNCTIGWGHKIHDGECRCEGARTCAVKSEKPFFKGISEARAEALFQKDLAAAERHVRETSSVPLSQCQVNGLADWYFNYGPNRDRMNADLRAGDLAAVSTDMIAAYRNPVPSRAKRDALLAAKVDCTGC